MIARVYDRGTCLTRAQPYRELDVNCKVHERLLSRMPEWTRTF